MKLSHGVNGLRTVFLITATAIITAGLMGCGEEEAVYQVEVWNRLSVLASVSLDGIEEQDVEAGETARFVGVSIGTHLLRAEASGFDLIEETIQVGRDIIWTIAEQ